jgi:hypothetical protein
MQTAPQRAGEGKGVVSRRTGSDEPTNDPPAVSDASGVVTLAAAATGVEGDGAEEAAGGAAAAAAAGTAAVGTDGLAAGGAWFDESEGATCVPKCIKICGDRDPINRFSARTHRRGCH